MNLPLSIYPCPIIDANFEIRFQSSIYSSAVFGIIYNSLKFDFPKIEKLPILQIPEELRETDPSLKHKPYYSAEGGDYIIQIGPGVFCVSPKTPYPSWSSFSSKIFDCLEKILKLNIVTSIDRVGLRYINFFENNIFDNVKLNIELNDSKIEMKNTLFRTQIIENSYTSTLQIANNVVHDNKVGSMIDIDTHKDYHSEYFMNNFREEITNGHSVEKRLFFSLLRPAFLETLNPIYHESTTV
jgi:uncharacterized protein (TIGR04255 family)